MINSSGDALIAILTTLSIFLTQCAAYKPLSDSFLRNITTEGEDFHPVAGRLLAPILRPRIPGTPGHGIAQHHFVDFFSTSLPNWQMEWHNSTAVTAIGTTIPVANLVFKREPPWTKPGQANYLTLAAHYDSKNEPEGFVGAMDSAAPCALLMHVARSIDGFVTQMHDEMAALGEGGTVDMDMGIQIVFLDAKEDFDAEKLPGLFGSRSLSKQWEEEMNPVGSRYPDRLSQISILMLLDTLGSKDPTIPSYAPTTDWAYQHIADLEARLRKNNLLQSRHAEFFSATNVTLRTEEPPDDFVPFMQRGVPYLHILPSPLPVNLDREDDPGESLDMPAVADWAKIVTGFALEWLDMMEVWPDE